jgi:hypothetical protein
MWKTFTVHTTVSGPGKRSPPAVREGADLLEQVGVS